MGTRIDISVAQQQLSRRVRELAQQNRAQRVRREDQAKEDVELQDAVNQGLAQASRRGQQRPGGNAADFGLDAAAESDRLGALGLRSGVPEYYFGPKVAATPRGGYPLMLFYQSAFGYQWEGGSGPPTGSNVFWVTASNGTTSLSYETANITDFVPSGFPDWINHTPSTAVTAKSATGSGGGFNFLESETYTLHRTEDLFTLPIDKDRCIVCLWQKYDLDHWKYRQEISTLIPPGPSLYSNTYSYASAAEYSACFLVCKNGIRQIGMPSALLSVVTARNRNATSTAVDNDTPFPVPPTFLDDYAISAIGGDPQSGKYLGVSGGAGNDAGIYEVLGLPPASPPRVYLVPFGPDEAGWIEFKPTKDDPPSYETSRFAPNRRGRIRAPESLIPPPPGVNVGTLAAWDWGKPGYCQQQLLALGFSLADFSLTPP